jgi:hypothetical protein
MSEGKSFRTAGGGGRVFGVTVFQTPDLSLFVRNIK